MVKTDLVNKTMTVGELIEGLQNFPLDMPVCTADYRGVGGLEFFTWKECTHLKILSFLPIYD